MRTGHSPLLEAMAFSDLKDHWVASIGRCDVFQSSEIWQQLTLAHHPLVRRVHADEELREALGNAEQHFIYIPQAAKLEQENVAMQLVHSPHAHSIIWEATA